MSDVVKCSRTQDDSIFVVYQIAFQYQLCRSNAVNEAAKWYGWMMTGSQSIGGGSWGDVDESAHSVTYYLHHLGIAFFPYITSDDKTGWYQ